jgi:hypothetical protein
MNILYTLIIKNKDTGRVLRTFNYYPQSIYDWEKLKIEQIKKVCSNYVLDKSDLEIEEKTSYGKGRAVEV